MAEVCGKALIVDGDEIFFKWLSQLIGRKGITAMLANDLETALRMIHLQSPDVVMVHCMMPDLDGLDVLRKVHKVDEDVPVILFMDRADFPIAVEAMKAGAYDCLVKPLEQNASTQVILRALNEGRLERRLKRLVDHIEQTRPLPEIMGMSAAIRALTSQVNRVARSEFTVLIQGETGTGKEIVARAIHEAGTRAKGPFVPVDCGAIPETLLESELFGHEKGAFTNATSRTFGKFQAARGGTLFLDEISNMPLGSQVKLLRVLQDKKVYRVGGGSEAVAVDFRLVAASNQDLHKLAESGSFRSDLFFRLNEFTIRIPPLRERKEDVMFLAQKILDITNVELGKRIKGFTKGTVEAMLAYDWPGNVRELRSCVRRGVLLADETIDEDDLGIKRVSGLSCKNGSGSAATSALQLALWDDLPLREIVQRNTVALEREVLIWVLRKTGGNKAKAARLLHIDYKTIHSKVKAYGIFSDEGDHHVKKAKG